MKYDLFNFLNNQGSWHRHWQTRWQPMVPRPSKRSLTLYSGIKFRSSSDGRKLLSHPSSWVGTHTWTICHSWVEWMVGVGEVEEQDQFLPRSPTSLELAVQTIHVFWILSLNICLSHKCFTNYLRQKCWYYLVFFFFFGALVFYSS